MSKRKKALLTEELSQTEKDQQARIEGPKKKKWSEHDIKNIVPITDPQRDMAQCYYQGSNICGFGSAGTGKAQPLDCNILTPSGWIKMKDVRIGTEVVTPDGTTAAVVEIFPQGPKKIYTVTTTDGGVTRCCGEHLWEVWYPRFVGAKAECHIIDTITLKRLIDESIVNVRLDVINPKQTDDIELPLDPYFLGVLLGDGNFSKNGVMVSSADQEILTKLSTLLTDGYKLTPCQSVFDFNITRSRTDPSVKKTPNKYRLILENLNLMGLKSQNKFIPEIYKTASPKQRWEIIRGLMDTDGSVTKRTHASCVTFYTTSEQLAKDVQTIVWSLGGVATITKNVTRGYYKQNGDFHLGLPNYTVFVNHTNPKNFFNLTRKQKLCREQYGKGRITIRRQIQSVEVTGYEEAQCIMIDHPRHLYITDDYLITHNTFIAVALAIRDVLSKNTIHNKMVIVRSNVATRDVGYLPGTLEEKMEVYEAPYIDILADLFGRASTYQDMKAAKLIQFMPTSFVRGLTWDDAIVIVDEAQNMTLHEINSVMTRLGENSRIILVGDCVQTDLRKNKFDVSGFDKAIKIFSQMKSFSVIEFKHDDIVRSGLVKEWIVNYEDCEN